MKILLINPPFYRFLGLEQDYVPISLQSVGSYLAEEGHEIYLKNLEIEKDMGYLGYSDRSTHYSKFLDSVGDDNHYIWQELRDTIEEVKPDKIGITVVNVKYKSSLKIIEIADSYNIPVMVGGQHPTTLPDAYPDHVEVVTGELEGRMEENGRLKELDKLPTPNYDILIDKYSPDGYGHIMSSRGCPFRCTFCASNIMWNNKVTFKSVDKVIEEMRYVHDRFGTKYFTFWDETWTMSKRRVYEFCEKYDVPAKWRCDTRADSLDEDMLKAMIAANLGSISVGVETSDEGTLDRILKHETTEDYKKVAALLNKYNVEWKAYMILGFPTDTEEMLLKSIEFVKSLKPFRITLSFFTPYVGTPLYEETKAMGLITDDYDMSLVSHQSPHNYFCPLISRERYAELKDLISKEVDEYNREALKTWR